LGNENASHVLLRFLVRLINIALLIAPDFAVRVTGALWDVLHAKAIHVIASIRSDNFPGDILDMKFKNHTIGSKMIVATVRLKHVPRLGVFTAIDGMSIRFVEPKT
jgi:hypothetical protein